jgi:hypothetical protein
MRLVPGAPKEPAMTLRPTCPALRRVGVTGAALLLTAVLGGCGSSSSSNTSAASAGLSYDSGSATAAQEPAVPVPAVPAAGAPAAAAAPASADMSMNELRSAKTSSAAKAQASHALAEGADKPAAKLGVPDAALTGRSIVYTAEESIQVADISRAVSSIEVAVDAAGGLVAKSERSGGATPDQATADLRLRIPPGNFESFLDRIGKLGTVSDRTLTGDDVTEQVVDVASRVATQRASVDRVRALMAQATSLKDVVALESQLSQREADLEALLAKQNKLKDQTDLATVTVHLSTPSKPAVVAPSTHRMGFITGLGNGWDAFTGAAVAAATVLGTVLPFALALAVFGVPLAWLWLRVRRGAAARSDVVG